VTETPTQSVFLLLPLRSDFNQRASSKPGAIQSRVGTWVRIELAPTLDLLYRDFKTQCDSEMTLLHSSQASRNCWRASLKFEKCLGNSSKN